MDFFVTRILGYMVSGHDCRSIYFVYLQEKGTQIVMKLVFENISKLYGDFPALSGINLSLENGDVTVNGNITAIVYFDDTPRKKRFSIFGR